MAKYYSTKDISCLVKVNDTKCKDVSKIDYTSNIIDYMYLIDEDGELISDCNDKVLVNKGDIVIKLYGGIVDGVYKREGRSIIVITPDRLCDMQLFCDMVTARESKQRESQLMARPLETPFTPDECEN